MKKQFILFLTAMICASFISTVHAQLRVSSSGDVKIGDASPYPSGGKVQITGENSPLELRLFSATADNTRFWAINSVYGFGFGIDDSGVGHMFKNIHFPVSIMTFTNSGYFGIGKTPSYKLDVNGTIRTNALIYSSGENLKTDIKPISKETKKKILKLNCYQYTLKYAEDEENQRTRYGLIAEEVQLSYPELVYSDENGTLAIDYIGLIPLLIDEIKYQRQAIEDLKYSYKQNSNTESVKSFYQQSDIVLKQNTPNPFNEKTSIQIHNLDFDNSAQINIYNMFGKEILVISLTKEQKEVILNANTFQPGMYLYSLIVDGEIIDTKNMVISE